MGYPLFNPKKGKVICYTMSMDIAHSWEDILNGKALVVSKLDKLRSMGESLRSQIKQRQSQGLPVKNAQKILRQMARSYLREKKLQDKFGDNQKPLLLTLGNSTKVYKNPSAII